MRSFKVLPEIVSTNREMLAAAILNSTLCVQQVGLVGETKF
ncbi:MAG TPA: hypothetical protein VFE27_25685 [Acidobacteriaceae bacterium]|jgi:hypothetical protein|nr:hypothetical protein [Acidobacteriaceae bacterium]